MVQFYLKIFLAITILFSFSCKKDDKWKIPASVKFKMDINRSPCLAGHLSFTGGNMKLSYFTFDGNRDQGGDVYFNKTYSNLIVPFDQNNTFTEWSFDIPQGAYSQIKISYNMSTNDGTPNMVLLGTYTNTTTSINYPVRFEFEIEEVYQIIAQTPTSSQQIVLDKNVATIAHVTMNPVYWFQLVTTTMMDTTRHTLIGADSTILINKINNTTIYEVIKDRIDDNVSRVIFN